MGGFCGRSFYRGRFRGLKSVVEDYGGGANGSEFKRGGSFVC